MGKYLKKFDTHEEYEEYISDYGEKEIVTEVEGGSFATYEDYDGRFSGMPFMFEGKIVVPYQTEQIICSWEYDYGDGDIEYDSGSIVNMAMFQYWFDAVLVSSDSVTGDTYEFSGWEDSYEKDYYQLLPIEKGKEVTNLSYDDEECPDGGHITVVESDFPLYYDKVTYLETQEVANFPIPNVSICMDESTDIHHVHYMPEFKGSVKLMPIDIGDRQTLWGNINIGAKDEFDVGLFYKFAGLTGYKTQDEGYDAPTPYYENGEWTKYDIDTTLYLEEMDDICHSLPPVEIDGETYYWEMPTANDFERLWEYANYDGELVTDESGRKAFVFYSDSTGEEVILPLADSGSRETTYRTAETGREYSDVAVFEVGSGVYYYSTFLDRHDVYPVRPVIHLDVEPI